LLWILDLEKGGENDQTKYVVEPGGERRCLPGSGRCGGGGDSTALCCNRRQRRQPCSAASPCRSFTHALAVVDPGGEIIVKDSGDYSSGFIIDKSVTIDAGGVNASVTSTSIANLCIINAAATDRVVLRGINFHGASVGANAIAMAQVGSLYVDHCSMSEFVGTGLTAGAGNLFVTSTNVRACKVDGLVTVYRII
jgi:hypothetical protein